jgi:hypothetical protein
LHPLYPLERTLSNCLFKDQGIQPPEAVGDVRTLRLWAVHHQVAKKSGTVPSSSKWASFFQHHCRSPQRKGATEVVSPHLAQAQFLRGAGLGAPAA